MLRKIGKALLLAGMFSFILLCGGCSLKFGDDLLLLPKVPAEYVELQQQLDAILQTGAVYAVAESGTNRQAVQLKDLDGDGAEEALAFFRTGTGAYQVYVFRRQGEQYTRIGMVEGYGSTLRAIYYPKIGYARSALALCWGFDEGGAYGMTIYGFGEDDMEVLLDMQYSDVVIADIDGNGSEELAFAARDSVTGMYSARAYQMRDGQYRVLFDVPMCLEVKSVVNMQFGDMGEGQIGLYIDSNATTAGYVTDLICYDGQIALNRTIDQGSGSGSRTWRSSSVLCADINGDGRIDVPMSHTFSREPTEAEMRSRLDWVNYDRVGEEERVSSTAHIAGESWYLLWPDKWGERVRIERSKGTSLARTHFYVTGKSGDKHDILTVYMFASGSWEEEAALYRGLEPLTSNVAGMYRCSINSGAAPDLALSLEEVKSLFHTIEAGWHTEEY